MKKILLTLPLVVSSIFFVYAQGSIGTGGNAPVAITGTNGNALLSLLGLAQTIVGRLVPLLVGVAVLAFFWFLIAFIWKGQDSPEEQRKSLSGMGYSVLALFVMVSVWGIIGFFASLFGINVGGTMPGFKLPGE